MTKRSKLGLNRFGEALDTKRQAQLNAAANRLLARHGFFKKPEPRDEVACEADQIGRNGGLRPTWTGSLREYQETPTKAEIEALLAKRI